MGFKWPPQSLAPPPAIPTQRMEASDQGNTWGAGTMLPPPLAQSSQCVSNWQNTEEMRSRAEDQGQLMATAKLMPQLGLPRVPDLLGGV